jgi:hypothetical protein
MRNFIVGTISLLLNAKALAEADSVIGYYSERFTTFNGSSNTEPFGIGYLSVGETGVAFPLYDKVDHLGNELDHDLTF